LGAGRGWKEVEREEEEEEPEEAAEEEEEGVSRKDLPSPSVL